MRATWTRARPGSIVAYADERQRLTMGILIGTPILTALMLSFGFIAAFLGLLQAAFVTLLDLLDWRELARDARRMLAGERPSRPDVDFGVGADCWTTVIPAAVPYRGTDRTALLARGDPVAAREAIGSNLRLRGKHFSLSAVVCAFLVLCELAGSSCHGRRCYVSATRTMLSGVRSATVLYRNAHSGACPTSVEELKAERFLDSGFSGRDDCGNEVLIACDGDDITASSPGPDGKLGTADDLVVPPPQDP